MRIASLLPLLLTASAAVAAAPEGLVDNPIYKASGPPGWTVEIGDDIGLWLRPHFFGGEMSVRRLYPYRPARRWDGIRRWRSRSGGGTIMIEARRGPCVTPGGAIYEDNVRVVAGRDNLTGCGGRLVQPATR